MLRQPISREDALIAHTRKNAYFVFQENNLGSIQPGKLADMVVTDRDYLTIPADQIKDITTDDDHRERPDRVRGRHRDRHAVGEGRMTMRMRISLVLVAIVGGWRGRRAPGADREPTAGAGGEAWARASRSGTSSGFRRPVVCARPIRM